MIAIYIMWSSLLITSLCYSSQHEIEALPIQVKEVMTEARRSCSALVISPAIQMMKKENISNYHESLLSIVSGSFNRDLIITLNDRYYVFRPHGLLSSYKQHPMQCNDEQCKIIVKYMYSILDVYNVPYDGARKEAEKESLNQLKLVYSGYVDSSQETTQMRQYINRISMIGLKSILIGIPIGIIGIICYRWYEMNTAMHMKKNEQHV
jgi:hypothetical protein